MHYMRLATTHHCLMLYYLMLFYAISTNEHYRGNAILSHVSPISRKLLSEWADGLESDRMTRINNAVRNGYLNGDSAVEIGRKIRGHAKPRL